MTVTALCTLVTNFHQKSARALSLLSLLRYLKNWMGFLEMAKYINHGGTKIPVLYL